MSSISTKLRPARDALRAGALIGLALAGTAEGAATGCPGAGEVPDPSRVERTAEAVACVINDERARRGRRRLHAQVVLGRAADRHARDMVQRRYFSHTTPDGQTFDARLRRYTHHSWWHVGETLAWGTGGGSTPEEIVRAWLRSPTHRRVMLDAGYRDMGIGVASGLPLSHAAGATFAADYGVRR